MNLDELQSVQSKERRNSSLQHLRDSFYDDVGEYVAELKNRRDLAADRADDPFASPEVRRLTDEIETATEVVEKVYERRMGKLVKRASLSAAGMQADTEGMTVQERDLFDDIVENIESNKADVLETLAGESADPDPDPAEETAPESGSDVSAASMMGEAADTAPDQEATDHAASDLPPSRGESSSTLAEEPGDESPTDDDSGESDEGRPPTEARAVVGEDGDERTDGGTAVGSTDGSASAVETDRVTVRITDDVGQIYGVDDREYDLERSDVIQLPEQNAEPLLQQDAAERLD